MEQVNFIQYISLAAIPLLFAITVHEVAHGWAARKFGDPTAMMMGRLTLNPIKHIDPIGTVLVPILLLYTGGLLFGWAKPVPVTVENLRKPQRDMAFVSVAGPLSNLLMALLWAAFIGFGWALRNTFPSYVEPIILMGQLGVSFNVTLAVLNLVPIPPLDGSRVLMALLPGPLAYKLSRFEMAGLMVVMLLAVSGLLGMVIGPPIGWIQTALLSLFGF